jgi:hypothetical protein
MSELTRIIKIHAPKVCDLVGLLLASDPGLDALRVNLPAEDDGSPHEDERDLAELGGDEELWASFPTLHTIILQVRQCSSPLIQTSHL